MSRRRAYEKLKLIINEIDPIGLVGLGAPKDEYHFEIEEILRKLRNCSSEFEVESLVKSVFRKWFREDIGKKAKHISKKIFLQPELARCLKKNQAQ